MLPPSGILLRVVATTTMGRCTMSATMATIGQLLLAIATLSACASATMATSIHPATTIERAGLASVASKSDSDSGSYEPCSRAHMNMRFDEFFLAPGARRQARSASFSELSVCDDFICVLLQIHFSDVLSVALAYGFCNRCLGRRSPIRSGMTIDDR